jgi:hypothetical protein
MENTTDNRSLNAAARAAKQHLPRYQQRRNPPAARIRSPRGSARRSNNLVAHLLPRSRAISRPSKLE